MSKNKDDRESKIQTKKTDESKKTLITVKQPAPKNIRKFVTEIRELASESSAPEPFPNQTHNGDESLESVTTDNTGKEIKIRYFAVFSKALKRNENNERGEVDERAYEKYLAALDIKVQDETRRDVFQNIENLAGGEDPALGTPDGLRLTNPLGGRAYDLEGFDTRTAKIVVPPPENPSAPTIPKPPADAVPPAVAITFPPAPEFQDEANAAEMAELYWMAVLRDTPFQVIDGLQEGDFRKPFVEETVKNLKKYKLFAGNVSRKTLFKADLRTLVRENDGKPYYNKQGFEGVSDGPTISQFLLRGTAESGFALPEDGIVAIGTYRLDQRQRTVLKDEDFLKKTDEWLKVQNGDRTPIGTDKFDTIRQRFIRTPRDIANYVHFDKIYQEYLIAACILLPLIPKRGQRFFRKRDASKSDDFDNKDINGIEMFEKSGLFIPGVTEPTPEILNPGNPYRYSIAQNGFATFGITHITTLLAEVSIRAHKTVFYQKWYVHRRLRPEEFGGRVHFHLTSPFPLYIKPDGKPLIHKTLLNDLKDTTAGNLGHFFSNGPTSYKKFPTYLLPQAFPEGCPTHPAYGAAHATLAGAAVTILKGLFNGKFQLTNKDEDDPQAKNFVPNYNPGNIYNDGTKLLPVIQTEPLNAGLTVGGELNKLASNIAFARSMAGVHWRSDNLWGLLLGEATAIELLREQTQPSKGNKAAFYREKHPAPRVGQKSPFAGQSPFFLIKKFDGTIVKIQDGKISDGTNDYKLPDD